MSRTHCQMQFLRIADQGRDPRPICTQPPRLGSAESPQAISGRDIILAHAENLRTRAQRAGDDFIDNAIIVGISGVVEGYGAGVVDRPIHNVVDVHQQLVDVAERRCPRGVGGRRRVWLDKSSLPSRYRLAPSKFSAFLGAGGSWLQTSLIVCPASSLRMRTSDSRKD